MTPAGRAALIEAEMGAVAPAVDRVAERRAIMESEWAEGRFPLAFLLATHWPLSVETAHLVLKASPAGITAADAQALTARVVDIDPASIGATRGH